MCVCVFRKRVFVHSWFIDLVDIDTFIEISRSVDARHVVIVLCVCVCFVVVVVFFFFFGWIRENSVRLFIYELKSYKFVLLLTTVEEFFTTISIQFRDQYLLWTTRTSFFFLRNFELNESDHRVCFCFEYCVDYFS